MVACPIQADQFRNTERIVSRAFGVRLDVVASSSHQLFEAILEVGASCLLCNTTFLVHPSQRLRPFAHR